MALQTTDTAIIPVLLSPVFAPTCRWDVSKLEPLVAAPHSPDNRKTARECSDVKIDRVYIGSCTGESDEDRRALPVLVVFWTVRCSLRCCGACSGDAAVACLLEAAVLICSDAGWWLPACPASPKPLPAPVFKSPIAAPPQPHIMRLFRLFLPPRWQD
jgi:hypothetical protein